WKHARKGIAQNRVADDAQHDLVEPEERPHEPGEIDAPAPPDQQADNIVHALLHRPDAKGRRRRILPRNARGPKHVVAERRLHKSWRNHADVDAVALQLQAQAIVESFDGELGGAVERIRRYAANAGQAA